MRGTEGQWATPPVWRAIGGRGPRAQTDGKSGGVTDSLDEAKAAFRAASSL